MSQILKIPRPGQFSIKVQEGLRILLLSDTENNLTRRIECKLEEHKVKFLFEEARSSENIAKQVNKHKPDLVICPYLKIKVPEEIYSNKQRPCLVVHPGIVGDEGASSLDWAILNNQKEWGVTVLQADEEMDGGAVWSSENFHVPSDAIKSSLYNGPITEAALDCVVDALSRYSQNIPATPLHQCKDVHGTLMRNMKHSDRTIDWEMSADEITRRVRMSDTAPGAIATLKSDEKTNTYRIFDAYAENGSSRLLQKLLRSAKPGEMVAIRNKSVLFKCGERDEEGVWIGQMKLNKGLSCKLPTTDKLPENVLSNLPRVLLPCAHDDIQVVKTDDVCYVYFDFYNGAMDCTQAEQLRQTLHIVDAMDDVRVVALMGGERFFSTGIHLCKIATSENVQLEAWKNINAIDDVIKTVVSMTDKMTVAVIRGNAGAGGAMFAAACDMVLSFEGALLTPSYRSMHLFGSEYWTYFFPRRVGQIAAKDLVADTTPMTGKAAKRIGLVDHIIASDKVALEGATRTFLAKTMDDGTVDRILAEKQERDHDWFQLIQKHREYELEQMKQNFKSQEFLQAMHNFVYKIPQSKSQDNLKEMQK